MPEQLSNKTKFYIATTVATDALDTLAEYQALTWIEIKGVFDLGEFGDLNEAIEVKELGRNRTTRLPGSDDGGTLDLIVNRLPGDPGQAALIAGKGNRFGFPFKIVMDDKVTPSGANGEFYFKSVILGGRISFGETDNVVRTTWTLAINSDRLELAAT